MPNSSPILSESYYASPTFKAWTRDVARVPSCLDSRILVIYKWWSDSMIWCHWPPIQSLNIENELFISWHENKTTRSMAGLGQYNIPSSRLVSTYGTGRYRYLKKYLIQEKARLYGCMADACDASIESKVCVLSQISKDMWRLLIGRVFIVSQST